MTRAGTGVLILYVLGWGSTGHADDPVRVRIERGMASVRIAGVALRLDGQPVAGDETVVVAAPQNGRVVCRAPLRVEAKGGVRVEGRALPGSVTLLPVGNGTLDVVNVVPLEPYVERAVASEVYASWPDEVLKAQAVVSRTYALHQRERRAGAGFDLEGSVLSQRYGSGPVAASVRAAVRSTRGQYLAYEGRPILAAFHTAAGGRTAASEEVWSESLPYLRPVDSPDEDSPEYFWSYEIEFGDLREALRESGLSPRRDDEVRVLERTPSGRVARLALFGLELSGRTLRQVLGGRAIRSTLFDVRERDGRVWFLGSGAGHGVGLSQWGARQMARQGLTYRQILAHYFQGTEVLGLESGHAVSLEREGGG